MRWIAPLVGVLADRDIALALGTPGLPVGQQGSDQARPAMVAYPQSVGRDLDSAGEQLDRLGAPPGAAADLTGYRQAIADARRDTVTQPNSKPALLLQVGCH